ncbi:Helicase, SNF2/RAD54 family [Methylophaga thiooxydans]|uniref:Helicase, SNF2/RAD54 family n=1 Tax=Methylophaga thiooxydans TaxID=392484 RepID=A0A0A0BG69_9GAMM|nr:DEAD/DEAH box helicase [Methylophaga thiooxydans]KGM06941.1 Helicase, SNF2/RAD54 family [Methylophaga thiooxydans]
MIPEIEELSIDYREFDRSTLTFSLSERVVTPGIFIQQRGDSFSASLGMHKKSNDNVSFIPCLSNKHNWVFHDGRIRLLPFDAPEIFSEFFNEIDPDSITFPQVLQISRSGIPGLVVALDPCIFEEANVRSSEKILGHNVPELNAKLYKYQDQGVAWMRDALRATGGVILADEMGLGKTLQIIALLLLNKPDHKSPALILCPTTLIANWCREIERFAPTLTYIVHRGPDRTGYYKSLQRAQIIITTYDTMVNDIVMFSGITWSYLICDEAQALKNPESKRRIACEKIPARYSIPVTGTPMENSLLDIWSLVDLAVPGMLGSQADFIRDFPDTEEGAEELGQIVDALILKRQVKDVANDLPERTDVDLPIEMDPVMEQQYSDIRQQALLNYGMAGHLVAVGQLALYCAHPWLKAENFSSDDWEDSVGLSIASSSSLITPKMDVCIRIIKESVLKNKKVLIFAAFNNCGELIKKALNEQSVNVDYWNSINGSTDQEQRQPIVDDFSGTNGSAVLVLNPKAAGAGLNITAATVVIHFTQNWNPAMEMQASARAHRRGQNNPVTIYRLYYKDTVEETMIERSQWKRELGSKAVPISIRDTEDLKKALSVSPKVN